MGDRCWETDRQTGKKFVPAYQKKNMEQLPRSMKRAAASGGSYRQPTDCSNCRGALVACDMYLNCFPFILDL
jgi:hypothetical protein